MTDLARSTARTTFLVLSALLVAAAGLLALVRPSKPELPPADSRCTACGGTVREIVYGLLGGRDLTTVRNVALPGGRTYALMRRMDREFLAGG
jgi:hypothetical protein